MRFYRNLNICLLKNKVHWLINIFLRLPRNDLSVFLFHTWSNSVVWKRRIHQANFEVRCHHKAKRKRWNDGNINRLIFFHTPSFLTLSIEFKVVLWSTGCNPSYWSISGLNEFKRSKELYGLRQRGESSMPKFSPLVFSFSCHDIRCGETLSSAIFVN